MKNNFLSGKRILSFALAATMVLSQASVVSAANQTDVSKAYDGSVSKVIGVETDTFSSYDSTIGTKEKEYYYVSSTKKSQTIIAKGNYVYSVEADGTQKTKADATTGFYSYNGKQYTNASYNKIIDVTSFYPDDEVIVVGKDEEGTAFDTSKLRDKDTGLYVVNGKYYRWTYSTYIDSEKGLEEHYVFPTAEIIPGSIVEAEDYKAAREAAKVDVDGDDTKDNVTKIGDKYYHNFWASYVSEGKYIVCGYANSEIAFGRYNVPSVSWNEITNVENPVTDSGKAINVGYQVEVNGALWEDTNVDGHSVLVTDETGALTRIYSMKKYSYYGEQYDRPNLIGLEENSKIRVRAVYYTKTATKVPKVEKDGVTISSEYTTYAYAVYKTGDWSDEVVYTTVADQQLTMINDLAVAATSNEGKKVTLTWTPLSAPVEFSIMYVGFDEEQTITAENIDEIFENADFVSANAMVGTKQVSVRTDKKYTYYVAVANDIKGVVTGSKGYAYSNVVKYEYAAPTAVPSIANARIEYSVSGSAKLVWDKSDASGTVYAYVSKNPTFTSTYYYDLLNAKTKDGDSLYLTEDDRAANSLINRYSNSISEGSVPLYYLETGTKYYVKIVITGNVKDDLTTEKAAFKYDDKDYVYYRTLNIPDVTLEATAYLGTPYAYATVKKTSVKLTMDGSGTGFVIYRKTGNKKFTKIATVLNNEFTDTGLKTGTEYTYKVYPYYYNKDTKVKTVGSRCDTLTVTPSKAATFDVEATMKSKTQIKLTWSKVNKATKYEVYRATKLDDNKTYLISAYGNQFKLVKTIKKAKTTSYVDKVAGDNSYVYYVVAYYKDGKKKVRLMNTAGINMRLTDPTNLYSEVKGTTATFKWDANKYAKSYKVRYIKYNAQGDTTTSTYVEDVATKAAYTVTDIPVGGHVYFYVSAFDGSAYSGENSCSASPELAAVKNVKASYDATTGAINVSWDKVEGAAYYSVYRSTTSPCYDQYTKTYEAYRYGYSIAKEANTDETNDIVTYREYYDQYNTIVGTSAVDNAILESNVTYYYIVVAYSADGTISSTKNVTVGKATTASPFKVTSVKNNKKGKVTLKYSAVQASVGNTTYIIMRATKKNGVYKKIAKTTKVTYIDKKVKKGKTYFYKVIATGTNGLQADFVYTSAVKKVKIKK